MATWFITGTSSGFGRHLTEVLLERGDTVAATSRRIETLDHLEAQYGRRLWKGVLDVRDGAAIKEVMNRAFIELGQIDVIVNNAGYLLGGALEETSEEQFMQQLETNLIGSIRVIRAAVPHLRAQGRGRILQLSSVGGQVAFPGGSVFHARKWGIEGFIESLSAELAEFNIQATLIEPGSAKTGLRAHRVMANALGSYAGTAARRARQYVESNPAQRGDPVKMALAMIACADAPVQPKRLVLGPDAYNVIRS